MPDGDPVGDFQFIFEPLEVHYYPYPLYIYTFFTIQFFRFSFVVARKSHWAPVYGDPLGDLQFMLEPAGEAWNV